MKIYIIKGYSYFYDKFEKHWVLYPIDEFNNRIEWDENENPIESQYFNNKTELILYLKTL